MTQTTNTIANLTAAIRKTSGDVRNGHANELARYIEIGMVGVLIGASDRYQAAEHALEAANEAVKKAMDAVIDMVPADGKRYVERNVNAVARAATTYVAAMNDGMGTDCPTMAKTAFTRIVNDLEEIVDGGHDAIQALAFAAMSAAMAEMVESSAKRAYRTMQTVIQKSAN